MEHSISWKANRFSTSQENYRVLWNRRVHYHTHNSSRPIHILNHNKPVHDRQPASRGYVLILTSHLRQDFPSGLFN